jgi:hypothetical protein
MPAEVNMIDRARFCARSACGHLDARHLGRGSLGASRGGCFACACPGFVPAIMGAPLDRDLVDPIEPPHLAGRSRVITP